MTKEFITNILDELGESFDTWTMLTNKVSQIGLLGDRIIYLDPLYTIVYFSSDGSMYIKNLTGQVSELVGSVIPDGYIAFTKNDKTYINKEAPYGIETSLGKIHNIIEIGRASCRERV